MKLIEEWLFNSKGEIRLAKSYHSNGWVSSLHEKNGDVFIHSLSEDRDGHIIPEDSLEALEIKLQNLKTKEVKEHLNLTIRERMNLIAAIKSGRPFKRTYWGIYAISNEEQEFLTRHNSTAYLNLSAADILAEDYELMNTDAIVKKQQLKYHLDNIAHDLDRIKELTE